MKKYLFILIIMLLPVVANAYDYAIDNIDGITIYYEKLSETENNLVVVRGKNLYAGDVKIPANITYSDVSYVVTKIGDQAFMGCTELTSINMPNTITSIGSQSFEGTSKLENISFSENITTIGEKAFRGCVGLTMLVLPPKLSYLEKKVFQNCTELVEVVLPSSLKVINNSDYDNSNPFGGCSKLTKVVVENLESWLDINLYGSSQPFYDYHLYIGEQEVKDLIIPDNIISIKKYAFQNCIGLESIRIPNHVTSVGRNAFKGCGKLKELYFDGGGLSLGSYALSGCFPEVIKVPSLDFWMNVVSPNIMANSNMIFRYRIIVDGSLVENLVIPEGVSTVAERAFCGCASIKSLSFSYTTTSIGYLSFGYCDGLETVTLRNGIASLGESAFSSCPNLKNVILPNSINEISPFCFSGCTSLKAIDIPDGVTRICGSAFTGCTSLETVSIPNSVKEIGGNYDSYDDRKKNHVFNGCTNLKSIEIPNSVEYIGSFSFYNCSNLTSVKLSDNLKYVSRQCFMGCERLKLVTIGENTERISYGAFWGCTSLQEITCKALEPPTANTQDTSTYPTSFKGVTLSNITLYVPSSSINSYTETIPWRLFGSIKDLDDADTTPKCTTPTITIKDGLLNFNCETEGANFRVSYSYSGSNKSSESNQLKLASTTNCHVSVYAVKEGYRDSDVATADVELCVGMKGDVNQDGEVTITDAVSVVNLILGQ